MRFVLKEGHLKLLKEMWVNWEEGEYCGSPCIDQKRPYGNSAVLMDVAETLCFPVGDDYGDSYLKEEEHNVAEKWHRETQYALWIVLQNVGRTVPLGIWEQKDYFKWVYIGPEREV